MGKEARAPEPVLEPPARGTTPAESARERYWLVRAVPGLLLLGIGVVAIVVAVLLVDEDGVTHALPQYLHLGPFEAVVVFVRPSPELVLSGILTAVGFVALGLGLEAWAARRITAPARSPAERSRRPLRADATRVRSEGTIRVTALIPARNEEEHLLMTLDSLLRQTVPPDAIWVIADNCTDATADVARAGGADVYETVDNHHRKAGGLNQLLAKLLPTMSALDVVLVLDADTVMVDDFIERGLAEFEAVADLTAVGGVFYGSDTPGLLARLQRNEYLRYSRDISRRKGRVFVLTGTASLFRADALRAVAVARGSVLPGIEGHVYDTYSLTEDNELTLALKSLGARMVSPRGCRVETELMPTWHDLWNQRSRWQRGALENPYIGMYGFSSATARYWEQQLGLGYGVVALAAYFVLMIASFVAFGLLVVVGFWFVIGLFFAVERTVTVWSGGWRARLLAAPLIIELVYAVFLQVVYVKSLLDIALGRSKHWNPAVASSALGSR